MNKPAKKTFAVGIILAFGFHCKQIVLFVEHESVLDQQALF
jgi:hypothetical protein